MKALVSKQSILDVLNPVQSYLEGRETEENRRFEEKYKKWEIACLAVHRKQVELSNQYDEQYSVWESKIFCKGEPPEKPVGYVHKRYREDGQAYNPLFSSPPVNRILKDIETVQKLIFIYSLAEHYELTEKEVQEIYDTQKLLTYYD